MLPQRSVSFWYLTNDKDEWPLVGEFSFDYDALDDGADGERLETYPRPTVEGATAIFKAMQKQAGWISFDATTKTAFALDAL